MNAERRILVVDDNPSIHNDFRRLLGAREGDADLDAIEAELFGGSASATPNRYQVDSALQGEEGFRMVQQAVDAGASYALAFVDMRMPPGWDGIRTIEAIFGVDDEIQIVVCTAYSEYSWEDFARRFPGSDRLLILKKPFDTVEVCQLAAALTEKWHLAKRAHLKRVQLEAMVGEQTNELARANAELRASHTRFALAAAGARDGMWDWDLGTGRVYYSPRFRAMIGVDDGGDSIDLWLGGSVDRSVLESAFRAHLSGRTEHVECEYRARHPDGSMRWFLCRGVATRDPQGRAVRAAGSLTDITDRKLAEEQLRRLALHDALTGLPNRTLLHERLERCILRAAREPGWRYAVLYLDLDRFKMINDRLGHAAGDQLLRQVAERIVGSVRALDTLSRQPQDPLARLGGDEFVLVLEGLADDADALRVADRVLGLLSAPFEYQGRSVSTGGSIGVAIGHGRYRTPEEILRDADLALYHAKSRGRRRFEVFDERVHSALHSRWELEGEMRAALGTGAFTVHYQPIVALASGRVESVEALVRWRHPERGLVSPAEFVPLAEETGLIVPLGLEVLETACRDLRRWDVEHPELAGLRVAVNVSPRQVEPGRFASSFERVAREQGVALDRIDVEITESVLMDADAERIEEIAALRRLGARIHLDDFGTGYCSLSYLRRVQVDALKIDRSFTSLIDSDAMTESIVRAILALAHNFGIQVIAEGVETELQRSRVSGLGCDQGQGYLFLRPVAAEDLPRRLLAAPALAAS